MDEKNTKAKRPLRKNLLVLLVTLVMLISIIPSTAFAVDSQGDESNQGSVVDTTSVDQGNTSEVSGEAGDEGGEPSAPAGDATKVITLYAPDGATVVSTVGVNDAAAVVLAWTLPDYTVDAAAYPNQDFAGWSDGVNLYPAGFVIQNLTADMSLTATLQSSGDVVATRSPRAGTMHKIVWTLPDGTTEELEVSEGSTVQAAGGLSPALTAEDDPSGNNGEFRGWFYDDGAGNLKQFYDNTTSIFGAYNLQAIFGELPDDAQAAPAVQKSHLLNLVPNLNLTTAEITSGVDYTAILTGSLSLPAGVWLEDVVFTFKVNSVNSADAFVLLKNNANPGEFGAFEVNMIDSYTLQLKVYRMESHTGGGSIEFGRFRFSAPNVTTPDGLQAMIELESISSGGVLLEKNEWQSQSPAWSVQQTATVNAAGSWIFENAGVTRSPVQFKRYEGTGVNSVSIWDTANAVSGVPYFSIAAKEDGKTTGYVHANSASVQVKISAGQDVIIPDAVATEFATGKSIFGNTVFETYYALNNAADLQAAGWTATAQMVGDDLVITFENSDVSAIDAFRTNLSVLKVQVLATALPLASAQVNGTYTMAYVLGDDSAVTYPSIGAAGDVKPAPITGGNSATMNIRFLAETSVAGEIENYLNYARKSRNNWYYNPNGEATAEQYGESSTNNTTYRNFISDESYAIPGSANTINLDRVWFSWDLSNRYASGANGKLPITELLLSETRDGGNGSANKEAAGWNSAQMNPVGFEVPAAGADTQLIIRVTIGGATYDIYNSASAIGTVAGFSLMGSKYIMYSGASPIEKFEFIYTVVGGAAGITVGANPRVMFELAAGHGLNDRANIYNYSYLKAIFTASGESSTKDVVQASSVQYRVIKVTPAGTKGVVNLTRSDGYRPGDLLRYTLQIRVDTVLAASHSKGLLLADIAGENVTLDPGEMHTQVTISHGGNSRAFANGNPTDLASVHGKTAGEYTYTDVPSTNDYGTQVLTSLPSVTTPDDGTAHYYAFSGNIYSGDVITIVYYARVAENADDGAPLDNSLWYQTDWSIGGGGGIGRRWDKLDDNRAVVAMDHAYGDISVRVRGAKPDGSVGDVHSYYLPGETFYLDILGGLVESSEQVENPVFLVQLPADVRFASDELVDVARKSLRLDTSGTGNRIVGDSGDPIDYDVQWLADKGSDFEEVPYGEATHMRLTVNGTLGKSTGNKLFSELVAFKVAVQVVDTPALGNTNLNTSNGVKVAMSAQSGDAMMPSIASNHKYEDKTAGGWPGKTSGHEKLTQGGKFAKALQFGSTTSTPAAGSFSYVYDLGNVNIYARASQATIAKERAVYPTKPTTTYPQEGLYLNDTLEFTVKVSNPGYSNLNPDYNNQGTFHPGPIADILPLGMAYVPGSAVASVGGVDVPVLVSSGTTTDGRQRLIITLDDGNYQLEAKAVFELKYTAQVVSIDHFTGTHSYDDVNRVSMYVDPEEVYVAGAKEETGDTAEWRDGVTVGSGYSRLQAKDLVVTLKDKRIVPGLKKTATSDTVVITTAATVNWKLTITNDQTADLPIEGYYVVDVLPKDFAFGGMLSGPAPQQFVNSNGQVVLLWNFDASTPLAIGGSQVIEYKASTSAYNDDGMLMAGYFTNTAYFRPTGQLFEDASIKEGTPVHAGDTTYSGDLTLPNGGTVVPLGRAIMNHHTVMLSSIIGAVAENRASYNGNSTSSRTSHQLVETEREKTVDYSFDLQNTGSWAFEDVRVFNTLPYAGDYYTMRSDLRDSNFAMLLRDTVEFSATVDGDPLAGITVYYSSTPLHSRAAVMENANWTEASSWSWGRDGLPKSFRVDMPDGFTLKSGEKLVLNWQLTVPDDVLVETQTNPSYNSAGYYFAIGDSKYYAEPERVGVYVKDTGLSDLTVQVQKLLQDVEMRAGERRAMAFRLEKYNPTTRGYDPVHLDAQSGLVLTGVQSLHVAGDPSTYGMFQLMAVNGATTTGSISKLPSGTYRVVESLDHIYSWLLYRYNVTGDGQEQYIGFVRGGTTIQTATYLIQNVYDGYYVESSVSSGITPAGPVPASSDSDSTTVTASGSGSGSGGGLSTLTVTTSGPPLGGLPGANTWALLNLICAVFSAGSGLLLLVLLLIRTLRKGKNEEGEETEAPVDEEAGRNERRTNVVWRLVSALVGIASLVTFILTQDMRNPMIFVDKWTPLMLAFALVIIFSLISMWYSQRKRDEEDDDYYYSAT